MHFSPAITALGPESGVTRDRANLLYAYGVNGVLVTLVASCFLVLMAHGSARWRLEAGWLGLMLTILGVRGIDIAVLHPRRLRAGARGGREIGIFALGTVAVGLVWAAFPILFFPVIGMAGRTASAVILAALAGGSATVLGPCLELAIAYGSLLLLPPAVMFLLTPGRENVFLGLLALAMHFCLVLSSRVTHRSVVTALRLGRANEALMRLAESQQRETQEANAALKRAQAALADANAGLEGRIRARTADLAHEVAERRRYAEALAKLASTDPLTGLHNRSTFVEKLACMLGDAEARGSGLAVLFLDLDNFKQINDVRGHAVGDCVLQMAALLLREVADERVELARWGGDEFVVAMPIEIGSLVGLALGRALRRALEVPLQAGFDTVNLDVTIGIALFPQDGRTQDELIRAADVAMYEAKKEGKGRIKLFDRALAHDVAERHLLEQSLRHAIANDEFALYFQPIVSARDGRCEAFEALLRWNHPVRGPVGPATFIPIAEQSGQIFAIGRWVLFEACRIAAAAGMPAVTVNVSVAQVLSGSLLEDVAAALAAGGLPADRLQIEITESMFVSDHVRVTPIFHALRAQGIKILLDDFGTGFSSLAYLGKLPIDVIKIDQSFVRVAERDGYEVIGAILSIARALCLQVTAEGVETVAQRVALSALGVERLQGYGISRPMPEAAVEAWMNCAAEAGLAAA
jgi:diguanylate cyclase (GGDEF)-like protein